MNNSSKQIPAGKYAYHLDQVQDPDFRQAAHPVSEPAPASPRKKHVHAYTLHARSNARLTDSVAPVAVDPQPIPCSSKG